MKPLKEAFKLYGTCTDVVMGFFPFRQLQVDNLFT